MTKTLKNCLNYLHCLWLAMIGRNPLREELESIRLAHKQNASELLSLKHLYCDCVDIMDEYKRQVAEKENQISTLQKLVENLRQRVSEKNQTIELIQHDYDQRIKQMKNDFQRRIETYSEEIDRLRGGEEKDARSTT